MQDTRDDGSSISDAHLSDAVTTLAPLENAYSELKSAYETKTNTQNSDTDPNGDRDSMLPSQHIAQLNWDLSAVDTAADALSKAAAALENAVNDIEDARKTAMAQWKGDAAEAADKDFGKISSLCSDQLKQVKGIDSAMTGQSGVVPALQSMASRIDSEAGTLAAQNADNVDTVYEAGQSQGGDFSTGLTEAQRQIYEAITTMKNFIWTQLDGLSGVTKQVSAYEQAVVTTS
jgi:uncharacterized protein YukE